MQERTRIYPIPAQFEGRCCIQYTDPLTGRVLEEIKGQNHVFEAQLNGLAALNSTALEADLLLTTGGYLPTDDDIPFIPGQPIGYGRVDASGEGLYRGAYRTADSYYNKKTLSKITNKYVYDFLQTQALGGPVNWVGLTGYLGNGIGTSALQVPHRYSDRRSSNSIQDCETREIISVEVNGSSNVLYPRIYINEWQEQSAERTVDLSPHTGTFFASNTACIAAELGGSDYIVAMYARKLSSESLHWYVYQFNSDFSSLKGFWEIPESAISGYRTGLAGYFTGGKVYFYVTAASGNSYEDYGLQILDLNGLTATYKDGEYYWDGQVDYDIIRPNEALICRFQSSIWYPAVTSSNGGVFSTDLRSSSFLSLGIFVDPDGGAMLCVPPSSINRYSYYYALFRSAIPALGGQWGRNIYNGSGVTTPFAYTRYKVPSSAPTRPEGSGMTVIYELDITI